MTALILDHLWQSTLILCLAALLTLPLRRNSAAARYWLWFAASVKFLVPLVPFAYVARRWIALAPASVLSAPALELSRRLTEPFVRAPSLPAEVVAAPQALPVSHLSAVLLTIWSLGCAAVLVSWVVRWRRLRRTVSSATPLALRAPIPLRESSASMEPGLIGIWRPVILLPAGLARRLGPAQMRGILAHELCHYRRRDNLTAAIHMLVEALFWFYPPIWWLGARLISERELACDESVLADGNDAEVYADSILKVCRFFRQSTLAGTAGISGGSLSRRVEKIMNAHGVVPVGRAKKLLVAVSIVSALCGMLLFGGLSAPAARARVSSTAVPTAAERARLLLGQEQPGQEQRQREVPVNPTEPAASSVQQALSQPQAKQMPVKPAKLTMVNLVRPLGEMKLVLQQANAHSASNASPAAAVRATRVPPVATPDLVAAAAGMAVQLWLEEVNAQLKSHLEYPSTAIEKMQRLDVMQDTVTLSFSVDHTGHVTSSHAVSEHHYQDLEQEAEQMLQLASALPPPPSRVSAPNTVVTVPVQFELDSALTLCAGSCWTANAAQSQPSAPAPTPGPAPAESTRTS